MPYAVGSWHLVDITKKSGKTVRRWMPPDGTGGRWDLRPLTARALQIPEGVGLFDIASVPVGYLDLGSNLDARLTARQSVEFASLVDLTPADLDAPTLRDVLWRLWTVLGDGGVRNEGAGVNSKGEVSLAIGGAQIKREKFDKAKHPAALRELQKAYLNAPVKGPALADITRRTGLKPTDITAPSGGASVSDEFTEASTISLGSHTPDAVSGYTAASGWTAVRGTWSDNSGGYATQDTNSYSPSPPASARCSPALSGSNMNAYINISAVDDFRANGIAARYDGSSESWLGYLRDVENSASHEIISVTSGGTPTQLAVLNNDYPDPTPPYVRQFSLDGSSLECFENGVSKLTYGSGGFTSYYYTGIMGEDATSIGGAQFDQFYAEDISAGGVTVVRGIDHLSRGMVYGAAAGMQGALS